MSVHLHLFGRPRITCDGQSHDLPFERRNQVLAYLTLKRGWVGREELAAMLWPGQASKLAFTNLRKTLFRLQSLPWAAHLETQGNSLRFQATSDVSEFELALRENRAADALLLRTGELLAGFDDDQSEPWTNWLGFERERLRSAWRSTALEWLEGERDPVEGIAMAARLLESDPIDEAALRAYMHWLARGGQVAAARAAYRDFVARLDHEFGLAPGAELRALHDTLGMPVATAPMPAQAQAQGEGDGFVGRSVELRRIGEQLAREGCRLLCLIGPGGAGKTRLAQRALRDFGTRYADGAAFVFLEDVTSPAELAGVLARDLGIARRSGSDPVDLVIESLRDRQMLLALDNFEHLLGAAPALERVLRECPRVQVIVTSRVRLGLQYEWLLPVEGLPCPDPEDKDHLEAFDAVRLFVNAAQRVEPGFNAAAEGASVIDICRQVDGLPLALELAAGWTRVLSCEAIAAELRQGTELLRAVDPSRPARHASIEVVFDQSWELLTAIERDALARLSVFRGGFTPEAARAVAAASLPVLGALMDKSLLRKDGSRIYLHPVVNQLASTRLPEGPVRTATEAAHAQYFHRMQAQLRRQVEVGERNALEQLDAEYDNCIAAWQWAVSHGQAQWMMASAFTLLLFADHRGRADEALGMLRFAAESRPPEADPRFEPLLLSAVAQLEYRLDRYAQAEATAGRALEGAADTSDHDTRLQCLKTLGAACLRLGKLIDAKLYYQQALTLAPAATYPRNAAAMLDNLALIEKALGRWPEAQRMSQQALEQFRRIGDVSGEALCLNNLADLYFLQGGYETARLHLNAGLALADSHGLHQTRGFLLTSLAEVTFKMGDLEAARVQAERAIEAAQQTSNRNLESWAGLLQVRVAVRLGDLARARERLRVALEIAIAISRPVAQLAGLVCFGQMLAAQGEPECARNILRFVSAHPLTTAQWRAEVRELLQEWGVAADDTPWTGPELAELAHRVAVEAPLAHAPLIASLRSVN
ncbi:MAG: tetratricopeptide repeat protein [Ramlibacter sp.]